jgi:hypothetical protein
MANNILERIADGEIITHAEHREYLVREAEENEKMNDQINEASVKWAQKLDEVRTERSLPDLDEVRAAQVEAAKDEFQERIDNLSGDGKKTTKKTLPANDKASQNAPAKPQGH